MEDHLDKKGAAEEAKHLIRSVDLLRGMKEVLIAHGDTQYRLQVTKAGKLILTK